MASQRQHSARSTPFNPYTNRATQRARQEAVDSFLVTNVPLDGGSRPRLSLSMTRNACDLLLTAINVYGLQQGRAFSRVDEVIRAAFSFHEQQDWIAGPGQRSKYIQDYPELADQLATTAEESIEHTHDISYDMSELDMNKLLAHLRLWALCDGLHRVYQIGVINVVPTESSVQLFNSMPGTEPTYTIFLVRTCVWNDRASTYAQSWTPLVVSRPFDISVPLQQATRVIDSNRAGAVLGPNTGTHAAVTGQQAASSALGTMPLAPQPTPSIGPAYRRARLHMPAYPHHTSARPFLNRSADQILAIGSGVEIDQMYGGLILFLGLYYPNHALRDMIGIKRENEENQRPWARHSNQVLHRIRDALQHIFGFDVYDQTLNLYTAARAAQGAEGSKAMWVEMLGKLETYEFQPAERCEKCADSAPSASNTPTVEGH